MSNPYHKPAGHPIPPKTNLMLSTTLLGPYDNLPTSEKTIVSAAIPPDVKERLFVDFLPRRGAVDKLMTRQLYMIDAYLCANPSILSIEENKREEVVNNLLNALNDFLSELKPANIATNNMKKILIGTATYRKRAAMPNTDCIGAENTYIPAVYNLRITNGRKTTTFHINQVFCTDFLLNLTQTELLSLALSNIRTGLLTLTQASV